MSAAAPIAADWPLRLGFLGLGRIGRMRMASVLNSGSVATAAIADPSPEALSAARQEFGELPAVAGLDDLVALRPDGIVIATPSAMHAQQSIRALSAGIPVFCQKPLGRDAHEVAMVIDAARDADRLLGVDLCYRHTRAAGAVHQLVRGGDLGQVYAVDLVFHNAYGPDKPWFLDRRLSGGGCVIDLGVHLVDLALWMLGFPAVTKVTSTIFHAGRAPREDEVEDFAIATLELATGCVVRIACSWHLPAGTDAVIAATFYGTAGGASFGNVNGSFFDFEAQRLRGTHSETIVSPPDDWSGQAIIAWARELSRGGRFDAESSSRLLEVTRVLDAIYEAGGRRPSSPAR